MKTVVIGLGNIGLKYDIHSKNIETHCKSIIKNPNFNLIAASDTNLDNCLKFSKKYKLPFYKDFKQMILDHEPEFIIISVNTSSHLKIIRGILGLTLPKLILCEKPIGKNFIENQEIVKLCKKNNIKLFSNYIRVADKSTIQFSNLLYKNFLSHKSLKGIIFYSKGIKNTCSHYIFFLISLFGNPTKIVPDGDKNRINSFDYNVNFTLYFKQTSFSFISFSKYNYELSEMKIFSKKMILNYKDGGKKIYLKKFDKNKKTKKIILDNTLQNYQLNYLNYIYHNMNKKKLLEDNIKKYTLTMKIIDKILYVKK